MAAAAALKSSTAGAGSKPIHRISPAAMCRTPAAESGGTAVLEGNFELKSMWLRWQGHVDDLSFAPGPHLPLDVDDLDPLRQPSLEPAENDSSFADLDGGGQGDFIGAQRDAFSLLLGYIALLLLIAYFASGARMTPPNQI